MNAQIVLDQPHTVWTNLDRLAGKVVLRVPSTSSITLITVKLEGESRTRLAPPPDLNGEVDKPREEVHKVLYKVAPVFPPNADAIVNARAQRTHFVLSPGSYEYPFSFKFPFNNSCDSYLASSNGLTLSNLRYEAKQPTRHVKTTLPPTLTAFPGMAEIRYFLKVTVKRKEFYKENPRTLQYFNFLPIEPPRRGQAGAESYARRQHQFLPPADVKGKGGLFSRRRQVAESSSSSSREQPPAIQVDVRLPAPAIITCNQDVPLRVIVTRQTASSEPLYLQSLQMTLIGHTHIQSHDIVRNETSTWVIASQSNIRKVLRPSGGKAKAEPGAEGEEFVIDDSLWKGKQLPNTVAPTFETCNIVRKYELDVSVGIGYGDSAAKNVIILPLRHKVSVYSGISPSATLLASMSTQVPSRKPVKQSPTAGHTGIQQASSSQGMSASTSNVILPPTSQTQPSTHIANRPPQRPQPQQQQYPQHQQRPDGQALAAPPGFAPMPQGWGEGIEDPPPSYEDAIAEDLPPLDGPRARYDPPPLPPGAESQRWEADRKGSM